MTAAPVFTLYDKDYHTNLGNLSPLPGSFIRLSQPQNDTGSGQVVIPFTDPLYSYIATRELASQKYIDVSYNSHTEGFFVENWEANEADSNEGAGRTITLSGRGRLALLARARVWDWQTPGITDVRYFGVKDDVSGYGTVSVPKGLMLWWLLKEARDDVTNLAGEHLTRFCWRWPASSVGAIQLDWDFTTTLDSNGNAWTDAEDMQFQVGQTNLLDVAQQIATLGYGMRMDFSPSTGFMLHAYNTRQGSDKSSTVIFQVGDKTKPIVTAHRTGMAGELGNAYLGEFSDPVDPFTEVDDATSIAYYGRFEGFLPCANASTADTAGSFVTAEMVTTKAPKYDDIINVHDGSAVKKIFTDYNVEDTIGYNNGIASTVPFPITGATLTWMGEDKAAQVALEQSAP